MDRTYRVEVVLTSEVVTPLEAEELRKITFAQIKRVWKGDAFVSAVPVQEGTDE